MGWIVEIKTKSASEMKKYKPMHPKDQKAHLFFSDADAADEGIEISDDLRLQKKKKS